MPMDGQVLWFLLAGFVLGFAASTLWEWLYFRGVRLRSAGARSPAAISQQQPTGGAAHTSPSAATTGIGESGYRSPAVFLEGEQEQPSYEPLDRGHAAPSVMPIDAGAPSTAAAEPPGRGEQA